MERLPCLCHGSRVVALRYRDNGSTLEPVCWGGIVIWQYCPECVGWVNAHPTAEEIADAQTAEAAREVSRQRGMAAPTAPQQQQLWEVTA